MPSADRRLRSNTAHLSNTESGTMSLLRRRVNQRVRRATTCKMKLKMSLNTQNILLVDTLQIPSFKELSETLHIYISNNMIRVTTQRILLRTGARTTTRRSTTRTSQLQRLQQRHRELAVRTLSIGSVDTIQNNLTSVTVPSPALEVLNMDDDDGT